MLPRKSREMASKKKGEMYETKLEVQKAKTYEKKVRVQKGKIIDEETISVTASVTNSGQSKEGMKGLIFGLNKEKWLLLEQNTGSFRKNVKSKMRTIRPIFHEN